MARYVCGAERGELEPRLMRADTAHPRVPAPVVSPCAAAASTPKRGCLADPLRWVGGCSLPLPVGVEIGELRLTSGRGDFCLVHARHLYF